MLPMSVWFQAAPFAMGGIHGAQAQAARLGHTKPGHLLAHAAAPAVKRGRKVRHHAGHARLPNALQAVEFGQNPLGPIAARLIAKRQGVDEVLWQAATKEP